MCPKKVDKAERKESILDAALSVFARRGYHQTRVDDIASEADVSKGTIYLYFPSRDAILVSAFERFFVEFDRSVDHILSTHAPPLGKIKLFLNAAFTAAAENESFSRLMLDFWAASMNNPDMPHIDVLRLYDRYRSLLAQLLEEAAAAGDIRPDYPPLTSNVIIAAADGIALHWMLDPTLVPIEKVTDQLYDLLTTGLENR